MSLPGQRLAWSRLSGIRTRSRPTSHQPRQWFDVTWAQRVDFRRRYSRRRACRMRDCACASWITRALIVEAGRHEDARIGESVPPDTRRLLGELGVLDDFLAEAHEPSLGSCSSWGSERRSAAPCRRKRCERGGRSPAPDWRRRYVDKCGRRVCSFRSRALYAVKPETSHAAAPPPSAATRLSRRAVRTDPRPLVRAWQDHALLRERERFLLRPPAHDSPSGRRDL